MSEAAPQAPSNTKRLSKVPIAIFSGILLAVCLVVLYSLNEQAKEQQRKASEPEIRTAVANETEDSMRRVLSQKDRVPRPQPTPAQTVQAPAQDVASRPTLGGTAAEIPKTSTGEIDFQNRPKRIENVEVAKEMQPDPRFDEFDKLRRERFKQAITSSPKKFSGSGVGSKGNGTMNIQRPSENASYEEKMAYYDRLQAQIKNQSADPQAQFAAKLQLAKQMTGQVMGSYDGSGNNTQASQPRHEETTDWQLHSSLEPAKALTINTGFVIPAIMVTGINSDLAGKIIGQVSQNVYDTATGKHLLIPQGTKLYGLYSSQIQYGQERVLVAWNRLIFPDGRTMDLGQMSGADLAGYSGFTDQVNNHYWKLFKGAFLLSMITAAVTYSDNKYNTGSSESRSATSAMSESLGQNLGDVSTELIRKNMNVSPTLEIRNGYRFNVVVSKDISFDRPYQFQQ